MLTKSNRNTKELALQLCILLGICLDNVNFDKERANLFDDWSLVIIVLPYLLEYSGTYLCDRRISEASHFAKVIFAVINYAPSDVSQFKSLTPAEFPAFLSTQLIYLHRKSSASISLILNYCKIASTLLTASLDIDARIDITEEFNDHRLMTACCRLIHLFPPVDSPDERAVRGAAMELAISLLSNEFENLDTFIAAKTITRPKHRIIDQLIANLEYTDVHSIDCKCYELQAMGLAEHILMFLVYPQVSISLTIKQKVALSKCTKDSNTNLDAETKRVIRAFLVRYEEVQSLVPLACSYPDCDKLQKPNLFKRCLECGAPYCTSKCRSFDLVDHEDVCLSPLIDALLTVFKKNVRKCEFEAGLSIVLVDFTIVPVDLGVFEEDEVLEFMEDMQPDLAGPFRGYFDLVFEDRADDGLKYVLLVGKTEREMFFNEDLIQVS